jgi:transposase
MGDDFSRFSDGRGYAASIGLIPKQHESADSGSNCAITRRGDPELRRLYAQAAFVHVFHAESHISEKYRRLRKKGKSHNEALVACANSMARMVFKLVTTHSKYVSDPKLLAEARGIADSEDIEDEMEDASKKD